MSTKILFSGLQVLLLLISISASAQQPTLEWAQRYDGKGTTSAKDEAVAVTVDAAGNSYVTGISQVNRVQKITTVKYAPSGQQLWAVQYQENATATDIAVDNTGGVYVIGSSNSDYLTIRYNASTGEQAWVQHYNSGGADEATAIALDNAGGVYVFGNSSRHLTTVRYHAATGEQAWVQRYDDGNLNKATAIAVDKSGGVFVTGTDNYSYLTIRYNASTGEQVWVQRYNGPGGIDIASAIAVDNAGGVYVTGSSTGDYYNNFHFATIRYDAATGDQTWVQRSADDFNYTIEQATGIAVDDAGGVYVTGNSSIIRGGDVALTIAYAAATGEERWAQKYQGQAIDIDISAIAIDNAGGVYITGSTLNNAADYVTIRYHAVTGEQTWVQLYGATQDSDDKAVDIAVDDNGGVYVTGFSVSQTSTYNYATVRYTASTGEQSWVQQYDGGAPVSASDYAVALAVDAEDNSYVTGTSVGAVSVHITTIKYAPSGEELWAVQMEPNTDAAAIAVDNAGGVYVTGSGGGNMGTGFLTVRYDAATGAETWRSSYYGSGGGQRAARAIAVDQTGGVYVTGFSFGSSPNLRDYATIRYDAATGEETWASLYSSSGSGINSATAIAVDDAGGVYVTGFSVENRYSLSDYATVRYDAATGAQTWARLYNGPTGANDQATAIAVDHAGGVYVTGYTTGRYSDWDYATVRYDAATGAETWTELYGSGDENDIATAIAVDNSGGVYVTGSSGNNLSSAYATVRYQAATGEEKWVSRYKNSDSSFERAGAIALDQAGGVYVTGYSSSNGTLESSDYATVRYDATTGEQIWADLYAESSDNVDAAVDIAVDGWGNVIVTGYSYGGPETDYDFLTIKYRQQAQCPDITVAAIAGTTIVRAGNSGSVYNLPNTGASSFSWMITDSQGNAFTSFTGQGTSSITVNWPSAPDFYKVSVSSGGPGGGCVVSTSVTYVHVFDPEAGFVTGGGWIESPANPAYDFMQTSKRAHLSLVARYSKRDEQQVLGSTMLVLQAGSFTFRSTSYEPGSLVITGNRAYYSGYGTVTHRDGPGRPAPDARQYGFMVSATDGDLGASSGADKFRLMIWEVNADGTRGAVVYDNQAGCSPANLDHNAEACTAIGGGNITIHKPKMKSVARKDVLSTGAASGEQELMVYPTSVYDRATITFSLENTCEYTLEVYDMKGALVTRISAGAAEAGKRYEHTLSVEGMSRGLYLARLSTMGKVQTVKLVVER